MSGTMRELAGAASYKASPKVERRADGGMGGHHESPRGAEIFKRKLLGHGRSDHRIKKQSQTPSPASRKPCRQKISDNVDRMQQARNDKAFQRVQITDNVDRMEQARNDKAFQRVQITDNVDRMEQARSEEAFQRVLYALRVIASELRDAIEGLELRPDLEEQSHELVRNIDALVDSLTLPVLNPDVVSSVEIGTRNSNLLALVEQAIPKPAKTIVEYITLCHPKTAAASLAGMTRGLARRGAARAIAPALTNDLGCWLAQSRAHARGGHTQMAPLVPNEERPRHDDGRAIRISRQLCHRLSVAAFKPSEEVERLLLQKLLVSHRCHRSNCYNPRHLVVEAHKQNMERKACEKARKCQCGLNPACLFDRTSWEEESRKYRKKLARRARKRMKGRQDGQIAGLGACDFRFDDSP